MRDGLVTRDWLGGFRLRASPPRPVLEARPAGAGHKRLARRLSLAGVPPRPVLEARPAGAGHKRLARRLSLAGVPPRPVLEARPAGAGHKRLARRLSLAGVPPQTRARGAARGGRSQETGSAAFACGRPPQTRARGAARGGRSQETGSAAFACGRPPPDPCSRRGARGPVTRDWLGGFRLRASPPDPCSRRGPAPAGDAALQELPRLPAARRTSARGPGSSPLRRRLGNPGLIPLIPCSSAAPAGSLASPCLSAQAHLGGFLGLVSAGSPRRLSRPCQRRLTSAAFSALSAQAHLGGFRLRASPRPVLKARPRSRSRRWRRCHRRHRSRMCARGAAPLPLPVATRPSLPPRVLQQFAAPLRAPGSSPLRRRLGNRVIPLRRRLGNPGHRVCAGLAMRVVSGASAAWLCSADLPHCGRAQRAACSTTTSHGCQSWGRAQL